MTRILIYEPNLKLSQKLVHFLTKEKYNAILLSDSTLPTEHIQPDEKTLAIMDAQMKWTDCRPILEALAEMHCPVLFITVDADMAEHLKAIYSVSCDVIAYPFSLHKLSEMIQRLAGEKEKKSEIIIDHQEKAAILDGKRVTLTAQEYALLAVLMETPDEPVSREHLLRTAWGYQCMGETRTVDVHVQRLRKKLGGERIETVYKCGYRLRTA